MSNAMGLTPQQRTYVAKMDKDTYEAIISSKEPYKITLAPFLFSLSPVNDEKVNARSEQILSKYKITKSNQTQQHECQKQEMQPQIEFEGKNFLTAIHMQPTLTKTGYYSYLKLSKDKGNRISKKLISNGFVKEHKFCFGKKRQIIILELTEKGHNTISIPQRKASTRGEGKIHQYLIETYHAQLKKAGHNAKISYRQQNKETDIGITQKNGTTIAIEISHTTTSEHEVQQAIKNLQSGYSKVLILSEKAKAQKILDILKQSNIPEQKVLVSEFVTEIEPLIQKMTGGE